MTRLSRIARRIQAEETSVWNGALMQLSLWKGKTCGRVTGHRWSRPRYDTLLRWHRVCRYCGRAQTIPDTTGTTITNSTHHTIYLRP